MCPHCAGYKPARDTVMTCQSEIGRDDIYMKIHYIKYCCKLASVPRVRIKIYYYYIINMQILPRTIISS